MPTVIQIRFPGRRYHATPWGSHVNEGQVEWPPSPWRILRALLSTGFAKLNWPAEGPPPLARKLLSTLASRPPELVVPEVSLAHSRHYVDAAGKKPLILDTWANVEDGVMEIRWDLALEDEERNLLAELAKLLGYLGRAESWVEARLVGEDAPRVRGDIWRASVDGPPGPGFEALRVRCPLAEEAYASWRATRVAPVLARLSPPEGKKPSAAQQKKLDQALAPFPPDLIAALCAETSTLQAQGWSEAPGSQELVFYRQSGAHEIRLPPVFLRRSSPTVRFALLSLTTPSRGESALPPLHRVYPQGRLLHTALASIVAKQFNSEAELAACLLGRVGDLASTADHGHAHLLHLSLGSGQRLDHVLVYAPIGLDGRAQEVLGRIRRTYMKGGAGELQVALAGVGDRDALRAVAAPFGAALSRVLGPTGGARTWISATPYVAPRLLKARGRDSLQGLVKGECARRGLPVPERVERVDLRTEATGDGSAQPRNFRHYVLHDVRHEPPYRMGHALRLGFSEPCEGPICLGYGAHAGLGLFETEE